MLTRRVLRLLPRQDVDDAASYSSRFASWAAAVRQHLNAAQLPVAVVNVTAASAKLTQLKPLRDQIFQIPQVRGSPRRPW